MGEKKKTFMVLKVDLQCCRCYKKIKKVLCKFPQIQDQVYNEEENLVIITVVYCCPESIKQKIISKGGGAIKSIEIKEPEKPKRAKPEKPKAMPDEPKAMLDEPCADSAPPQPRPCCDSLGVPCADSAPPPPPPCCDSAPSLPPLPPHFPPWPRASDEPFGLTIVGYGRIWKAYEVPVRSSTPESTTRIPSTPESTTRIPSTSESTNWIPIMDHSIRTFGGCSEGPCYEGYGRPVYDSCGGGYGSGSYVSRGDYYSEENPTGCTVM